MNAKKVVSGVVLFVGFLVLVGFSPLLGITSFTMTPSGPVYNFGDEVMLAGTSTCGTVRFEIDGQPRSEIGTTNQSMLFKTAEWGSGNHHICFVARCGDGGWDPAERSCKDITVKPQNPPPPTQAPPPTIPPSSGACVNSLTVKPYSTVYTMGDQIKYRIDSSCVHVSFVIDFWKRVSEISGRNWEVFTFNSAEFEVGQHTVCGQSTSDNWNNGASSLSGSNCHSFYVADQGNQPPPPQLTDVPQVPPDQGCTNSSAFVSDVTIPDNTWMSEGQTFTKTWRIRNTGSCVWKNYSFVHIEKAEFCTQAVEVPKVQPGETVDVSVYCTAPQPGQRKSVYQLRDAGGNLFGEKPYVLIIVQGTPVEEPTATQEVELPEVGVCTAEELPWFYDPAPGARAEELCKPQCVKTARGLRKDTDDWAYAGDGYNTPMSWLQRLDNNGGSYTYTPMGQTQALVVSLRPVGSIPQAYDLIIEGPGCGGVPNSVSGGHVMVAMSTGITDGKITITDSNSINGTCNPRNSQAIAYDSCMRFISSPVPVVSSLPPVVAQQPVSKPWYCALVGWTGWFPECK